MQPALAKHWPALDVPEGARVLVPLCGKSLDMIWLAGQGHTVIGSELSELAVDAFLKENALAPDVRDANGFIVKSAGPFALWCGDFFALDAHDVNAAAAYDRAALVAMPPHMQPRYAAKMAELLPTGAKVLLIGLDYDPAQMQGPPFNTSQAQRTRACSAATSR